MSTHVVVDTSIQGPLSDFKVTLLNAYKLAACQAGVASRAVIEALAEVGGVGPEAIRLCAFLLPPNGRPMAADKACHGGRTSAVAQADLNTNAICRGQVRVSDSHSCNCS